MAFQCHAICKLNKASGRFGNESRYCSVCGEFLKTRTTRCLCCGNVLSTRPRALRFKETYLKRQGLEIKRY